MIELLPVHGMPEVRQGDDLGALIVAHAALRDGDVVVVSQKIVSKAEGALRDPLPGEAPADARRRIARALAVRVLADSERALVVQTPQGLVCANAGIDASNIPGGRLALLPDDPDASARDLRARLAELAAVDVHVVISDTFGRPWRLGQTDVAIGVAGFRPIRDERGGMDREGVRLEVTEIAVADELAAAADLVRRKADGVPVVIVRGAAVEADADGAARQMVRSSAEDQLPRGVGGLAGPLGALRDPEPLWTGPVAAEDLSPALTTLRTLSLSVPHQDTPDGAEGPMAFRADGLVLGVLAGLLADRGYEVRLRGEHEPALVAGRARRPVG